MPGAGLICNHTMTTGSWSSLAWSIGDGVPQLLPAAGILQKVYLNTQYITAYKC